VMSIRVIPIYTNEKKVLSDGGYVGWLVSRPDGRGVLTVLVGYKKALKEKKCIQRLW
jgi:hypothetical protein